MASDVPMINLEGYGKFEMPLQFKLKEMRIIERYSGGEMEGYGLSKVAGMIHVAIARAKPDLSFEDIEAVVDEIDVQDLDKILADAQAGQSPPTPERDERLSENNESLSDASGITLEEAQENETRPSSGSQDLAGFRSFHGTSAS